MEKSPKVKVTAKWESETRNDVSGLMVIYVVKNVENESLPELLVFFRAEADPRFTCNQELTIRAVNRAHPHRAINFDSLDDIPSGMVKTPVF